MSALFQDLAVFDYQDSIRAGFSAEFVDREDGYAGLRVAYGLSLGAVKSLEHGLTYDAIQNGSIDLTAAYTTDGKLLRYRLRVLEDDRRFFPPYHAAPVVRREVMNGYPELRRALEPLAGILDDDTMRRLNSEVDLEKRRPREVVRDFLVSRSLLR